jgi:hypothetical protein
VLLVICGEDVIIHFHAHRAFQELLNVDRSSLRPKRQRPDLFITIHNQFQRISDQTGKYSKRLGEFGAIEVVIIKVGVVTISRCANGLDNRMATTAGRTQSI